MWPEEFGPWPRVCNLWNPRRGHGQVKNLPPRGRSIVCRYGKPPRQLNKCVIRRTDRRPSQHAALEFGHRAIADEVATLHGRRGGARLSSRVDGRAGSGRRRGADAGRDFSAPTTINLNGRVWNWTAHLCGTPSRPLTFESPRLAIPVHQCRWSPGEKPVSQALSQVLS